MTVDKIGNLPATFAAGRGNRWYGMIRSVVTGGTLLAHRWFCYHDPYATCGHSIWECFLASICGLRSWDTQDFPTATDAVDHRETAISLHSVFVHGN